MAWDPAIDLIRLDRSRTIQRSTRCFHYGLIGLLPIVGIVPAALAIILFRKVAHETGDTWKPEWIYTGWLISLLYGWMYTWIYEWHGFLWIIIIGIAIQIGAFFRACRHPSSLAWNPARHLALLGLFLAFTGLASMLLLLELIGGFYLEEWSQL